jgi:1,4-dihydroxy-2-naphthoate octaprenyltransferase
MGNRTQQGTITGRMPPAVRVGLWWQATRPQTVLTSLVPALAGGLVAIGSPHPRWWLLAVALLALGLLHAGTNASNDVEDFARGVDPPDKERNSGVFTGGRLAVAEGRRLYGALFAGALALGVLICAVQGPAILVIGVIGLLGGLLYTAGPAPYKYIGLGDPAIVLLMGPLMTQGAYTAVTGDPFDARAFWLGLGPGLLIECVLAANNLADLESDRAAGLRTLAVRIGLGRARRLFLATVAVALPVVLVLWLTGLFDAWILLPLAAAPRFVALARQARAATDPSDPRMQTLLPRAAVLHLSFSVLLCAGVVLSRA